VSARYYCGVGSMEELEGEPRTDSGMNVGPCAVHEKHRKRVMVLQMFSAVFASRTPRARAPSIGVRHAACSLNRFLAGQKTSRPVPYNTRLTGPRTSLAPALHGQIDRDLGGGGGGGADNMPKFVFLLLY
jgi:hypothetical protein